VAERGHVLIVDDNAALVDNLVEILSEVGYTVSRADSCKTARSAAARGVRVALVDVILPDGSGIELARELRAEHSDAEVILLTGHASTESAAAAVRAGAFAYLVKPTATGDLLLTIEQAIAKVRLAVESKELLRRAIRAEKLAAIGTLAAGLSHEIRNPLNAATLQLAVLENGGVIAADRARLKQALLNLLLNAIEATPHGGWVRIELARERDNIRIAVEDSGPGIPPELRERVFEPFFTTKEGGSGLGLPQVHAVVQQHGGTLEIETGSVGGARFVLTLPG
jgi:signal transduction histidine kinase